MKKILVLILALALLFSLSLTGCGDDVSGTMTIDSETLDGITEVAVGSLGKYDLSGDMFGTYAVAIPPEVLTDSKATIEFYESESDDSAVQLISVQRWKTSEPPEADGFLADNYTEVHNDVMDLDCTVSYGTCDLDGIELFTQSYFFEDGDYTVKLTFYGLESFEK